MKRRVLLAQNKERQTASPKVEGAAREEDGSGGGDKRRRRERVGERRP